MSDPTPSQDGTVIKNKPRGRARLFWCSGAAVIVAFLLWANWWRIAFRSAAILGHTESALIIRLGLPEHDSRLIPYTRIRPTDEQQRIELGLDEDSQYTLIWIVGVLGTDHVKIHFSDGVATGVERDSHR